MLDSVTGFVFFAHGPSFQNGVGLGSPISAPSANSQQRTNELRNFGLFSRPASSAPCATVWTEFPDFACPTRTRRRGDRIARCPFMAESGLGAFLLLCPLSRQSGHRSSCGLTASVEFDP